MPIYRAEQARLSFASEAGLGGYFDAITAASDVGGGLSTTLNGAHAAGSRSLIVAATTNAAINDYIRIEALSTAIAEIRRIVRVDTTILHLDYPTAFPHATGVAVVEVTNAAPTGSSFITFLPGVYEEITTPDLTPELLPQYFLSTTSTRNWSYIYRGKQEFTGSIDNMILLNGYPIRFGIGSVRTVASAVEIPANALTAASSVGARTIGVTAAADLANADLIEIERGGTNPEVRRIVSGGGTATLVLNYPLLFAHANAVSVREASSGATFTHTIIETSTLDSVTWHLLMRDSGETAANDFIRRYVGGKVNTFAIHADEGGLLRLSWDNVIFTDLVHNQTDHSSIPPPTDRVSKGSRALVAPAGIGGDYPATSGVLGTPVYPTTDPYYFSQGRLRFFGIDFARIRTFHLEVNNNLEPRYYVRDIGGNRGPTEIQETRRAYRMTARIAMEDSVAATATTRTLWKELILESNYSSGMVGFEIELLFTRGTNDTIRIRSPIDQTPTTTFEDQGCFFVRAPHNLGTESPIIADGEILLRNCEIIITDSIAVYP